MTRRPSSDLSDLPRMVPDRDDIALRRGPSDNGQNGGPPTPGKKGPRVWPLYFLILILAGGLGYTWYEFMMSRDNLAATEESLTDARDRIAGLEGQLSDTDESLSLNATAIQANFNNILAEIRQLWEVADRRNLDWIRANQDALENLESLPDTVASVESGLADAQSDLSGLEEALADMEETQSAQGGQLGELEDRLSGQTDQIAQINESLEQQSSQLDVVTNRAESATEASTDNSQQLNTLEAGMVSLRAQLENEAATRSDLGSTVSTLRSELDTLENEQDTLAETVSTSDFTQLRERVETIDNARADMVQRLSNLQAQIESLRDQLSSAEPASDSPVQDVQIIENPG